MPKHRAYLQKNDYQYIFESLCCRMWEDIKSHCSCARTINMSKCIYLLKRENKQITVNKKLSLKHKGHGYAK
jgi:hypothetical protein